MYLSTLNTIDQFLKGFWQALEVQGEALGPWHFRAYDGVVAKYGTTFWQHWWHYFGNISNSWYVLIVKHEANVIMNLTNMDHKAIRGAKVLTPTL